MHICGPNFFSFLFFLLLVNYILHPRFPLNEIKKYLKCVCGGWRGGVGVCVCVCVGGGGGLEGLYFMAALGIGGMFAWLSMGGNFSEIWDTIWDTNVSKCRKRYTKCIN